MILTSFTLNAQTEIEVIKQLEGINNFEQLDQCERCESEDVLTYTPQKALQDINSGKLVFMGRDKFPGSAQNYTCVYKSDAAYVLYNNCMANKKEAGATDIEVISFNGGVIGFYIENNDISKPVSEVPRSEYSMSWKVMYTQTPKPGNLDVAGLKKYMDYDIGTYGGCYIGKTFEAQKKESKADCFGKISSAKLDWVPEAEKFWQDPGEEWLATKQKLRKTVVSSKF